MRFAFLDNFLCVGVLVGGLCIGVTGSAHAEYKRGGNKVLAGSSQDKFWTADDVASYCAALKTRFNQDAERCVATRKKDIGHIMSVSDIQEVRTFQDLQAKPEEKAGSDTEDTDKGDKQSSSEIPIF